ncbi:MAG: phosphoenolpyruvate synthase, partial [Candidatus Aenigmatarchaeota archaeon]
VIEACWGLGETLVSGAVEPDHYVITKDMKIVEKRIGRKEIMKVRDLISDRTVEIKTPEEKVNAQILTNSELMGLVKLGLKIEKHYGNAQDIEWAIENGKIYILQARAVTTEAKLEKIKIEAEPILRGLGVSPGIAKGYVKIISGLEDIVKVSPGDILVTTMTSPDLVPTMSKCSAIITDSGGQTCHAAIVSREMGIPCIVGTQTATKTLKDGQFVTVDAYHGFVYPGEVEIKKPEVIHKEIPKTRTAIKVNLAFPEFPEYVPKISDGVGLLRIEHMIIKAGVHPSKLIKEGKKEEYIQILLNGIRPIAKSFYPKPVWVRSLDARSDEFRNLRGGEEEPKEDNPQLGWHGIRRSIDEPEILISEFEAVRRLHEEGFDNVHLMLPFVISVEEFRIARKIAKEVKIPKKCIIGIMVETPAAALTIEDFCKEGVGFISFGTNDLSQLTLGIDRNNAKISKKFTETHKAVKRMISEVIKVCRKYKIETSICGEAPSNIPDFVEFLVKCGITSISVNIDALEKVRELVYKFEKKMK